MQSMFKRWVIGLFSLLPAVVAVSVSHAQPPSLSFDIGALNKPDSFKERKLGSEKMADKKFTKPRRFFQNTFTHYNYYFNANNKLNEVLARAKDQFKDNYEELLPFYNFTLETTAQDKNELDSVIYKATAGILLHDLRSDWVDNMYMLIGRAYYYRKAFDSAAMTFQFMNYAFQPQDKSGFASNVGSGSGKSVFSIATPERRTFIKKMLSRPPSRNAAFIWQARTLLGMDEPAEAAGIIEILRNDPNFPARLKIDLNEVMAYWFYKQQVWDSAAVYLEKSLDNAVNRQEKARWEYLTAQLYERTNKPEQAIAFYNKSIKHTFDPILDIYARLAGIRLEKGDKDVIDRNIAVLVKMARKDKYLEYRDIIFYTAAQMELERNNYAGARSFLLKSVQFTSNNPAQRNKAFMQLGDLAYKSREYQPAYSFYDSVTVTDPTDPKMEEFLKRKAALALVVDRIITIQTEDSLLRLAALTEGEREDYLNKLLRRLRKEKGLDDFTGPLGGQGPNNPNNQPASLFPNDNKGEWYFNNPGLKARGFSEFRANWGNRPNVDNWRRNEAIRQMAAGNPSDRKNNLQAAPDPAGGSDGKDKRAPDELTYEALLANIPLTPEKAGISNDTIQRAMFDLGVLYQDQLEDYQVAISTFEDLNKRYPDQPNMEKTLYNLYYCYKKLGDLAKANYYKQQLSNRFGKGKYARFLNNPEAAKNEARAGEEATRKYEEIYNLFIEGKFERALAEKKLADSIYQENKWSPQLLYIEAIYHIKQRSDSQAMVTLNQLIQQHPNSPLREKSERLIDVLTRRKEIEQHLTDLKVEREVDNRPALPNDPPPVNNQPVVRPPVVNNPVPNPVTPPKDSVKTGTKPPVNPPKPKPNADSLKNRPPVPVPPASVFRFQANAPHLVAMVLDKVDPVYVTESKNGFSRYNRANFYNQTIDLNLLPIDAERTFLTMGPFSTADSAYLYLDQVRKASSSQIIPWLKADKYSFILISNENLELLKTNKDLPAYLKLLKEAMPGKF